MAKLEQLSDEELDALSDELAAERTKVRLDQLEVQAERDLRRALASMPESSRRVVTIRLEGNISPTGERS